MFSRNSAITNHFDIGKKRPKLLCETAVAYEPADAWSYTHHPYLTYFANQYYLSFSSGHTNEDDVGQRIIYCTSDDFMVWSEPRILAEPEDPAHQVQIACGLYTDGNQLVAYYHSFSYQDEVLKNGRRPLGSAGRIWHGTFCVTSQDGMKWSSPIALPAFGGNSPIIRLRNGRLFTAGGRMHAYSDCTDGVNGWIGTACFPEGYPSNKESTLNDVETLDTPAGLVNDNTVSLCEGAPVELDDGTLHVLLRSGTPWLWACQSHDSGETFSQPVPTCFSDNRTKFALGRLINGRYFYVGTPDPFPPRTRHVLVLSTSDDGLDYDRHYMLADAQYKGKYPGIDKNGIYGYPSVLERNGYLHIAVSICKEQIIVLRVPCDTL